MDIKRLKEKLDQLDVNPAYYSLNGELNVGIVLYCNYSKWEVFDLDERGGRSNVHTFYSESEACEYILEYFRKSKDIEKIHGIKS